MNVADRDETGHLDYDDLIRAARPWLAERGWHLEVAAIGEHGYPLTFRLTEDETADG